MADPFEVFMLTLGAARRELLRRAASRRQALIIDPGDEADVVVDAFDEIGVAPPAILVTHGHFDHFGGVDALAKRFAHPRLRGRARRRAARRRRHWAPSAGFAVSR